MSTLSQTFRLVERDGRAKYWLGDRPVNGGDPIDLCFSGGWVTGRFEWTGVLAERPRFHYSIALVVNGCVVKGDLVLPEGAVVRWPGGA
jgi:hypothetical protein